MKTTKEMIAVMEAFDRGEQIQVKTTNKKCDWEDVKEPYWQWNFCDYRVKPKKKYVPFDTAEEFLAAQRVHGEKINYDSFHFFAYVNCSGVVKLTCVELKHDFSFDELLLCNCKFEDGTPCGKEV